TARTVRSCVTTGRSGRLRTAAGLRGFFPSASRLGSCACARAGRGIQISMNERNGFGTVPLGGPEQPPDLAALAVDQERRRDAGGRELARRGAGLIDEDAERLEAKLLVEALDRQDAAAIDRERQDDELLAAERGLQAIERRHFAAAGDAPCRP